MWPARRPTRCSTHANRSQIQGAPSAKKVTTLQGDAQDGLTLGDSFYATLLDVTTVLGTGRSGIAAGTLCGLVLQRVQITQGKAVLASTAAIGRTSRWRSNTWSIRCSTTAA